MSGCAKRKNLYLEEGAAKGVSENVVRLYKKSGLAFNTNLKYDEMASVYATNQLFLNRRIVVREMLEECKRQFSLWTKEMGRAKRTGFGLCFALCNIVSMLRESRQLDEPKKEPGYTRAIPDRFVDEPNPLGPKGQERVVGMADYFG